MKGILQIALDKAGNLVSIYDVKTGIDCDCYCPECKEPLEAKNKNKTSNKTLLPRQKVAHFAHYDGSICLSATETAIHLLAKMVLKETKMLLIPNLFHKEIEIIKARPILFDNVEVEKELESETFKIKPDIILYDYDSSYNEHTGRSKTYKSFNSKDQNVYCPKQLENGKTNESN